jgi:hypothetical protein
MVTMSQKSSFLQPANSVSQVLILDTPMANKVAWANTVQKLPPLPRGDTAIILRGRAPKLLAGAPDR